MSKHAAWDIFLHSWESRSLRDLLTYSEADKNILAGWDICLKKIPSKHFKDYFVTLEKPVSAMYLRKKCGWVLTDNAFWIRLDCQLFIPRDLITPEESLTSHKREKQATPSTQSPPCRYLPQPNHSLNSWWELRLPCDTNINQYPHWGQVVVKRVWNSLATVSLL